MAFTDQVCRSMYTKLDASRQRAEIPLLLCWLSSRVLLFLVLLNRSRAHLLV